MKNLVALFVVLALAVSVVPAFAAEPTNPTPLLPQPVISHQDGRIVSIVPMLPQPAGGARFYTQFELQSAAAHRQAPGTYIESPGGSGGGAGSAGGDGS